MSVTVFLVCSLIALVLEAFFSGTEMALISSDRLKLRKLADAGNSGAKTALQLLKHPDQILSTTLVGTCLCVSFQAAAVTLFLYKNWGPEYEAYSTFILSPIVLIFGEVLPKTMFQRYAETIAPKVAPLLQIARIIFAPLTYFLGKYAAFLSRSLEPLEEALTGKHRPSHREELRYLLTHGQKETTLKTSERKMIRRILDFSKADAKKALIPLVKLDMVENTLTLAESLEAFRKYNHSRLPVYKDRVDNIIGVLHVFEVFAEKDHKKPVTDLMQAPFYAPQMQQLDDLLFTMQKKGIQMAIVVDEYGGAVGAVTVEDIVEEIVGDIQDEYDPDEPQYREITENEYLIQARMEIEALNEKLKLNLPRGPYETLAGFLLQQFNRIPEEGDELYYGSYKFTIRKATNRAVESVHLNKG